jgi:hypothetical protein
VAFTPPSSMGNKSTTIEITLDDLEEDVVTITLNGTGTTADGGFGGSGGGREGGCFVSIVSGI